MSNSGIRVFPLVEPCQHAAPGVSNELRLFIRTSLQADRDQLLASTANSIGSCCSTSLTKPLTTSAVASSAESALPA